MKRAICLSIGAAIGSTIGTLIALGMTWAIPDIKLATAYACGKLDLLYVSQGLPPSRDCADTRAIYEARR